jgi:hypothetical protein
METITLRDVALRLAKLKQPTTKAIADTQLLSLLKSGELRAGFDFPGCTKRWVSIPSDYGLKIDSRRFRSIRKDEGATFKVSIRDFADKYSQLVFDDVEEQNVPTSSSNLSLKDEFRIALAAASRKYEVVVRTSECEEYEKRQPAVIEPVVKGKGGRHPLTAWHELSVIIPAYLLAHHDERHQPPVYKDAGDEIYRIAREKDRIDANSLPKPDTLKDVISQIYRRKEDILKQ